MSNWESYLPPFKKVPVSSYGTIHPRLLVIHVTENKDPNDGAGVAQYNRTNSNGYHWHWTIGSHGEAYRQLEFNEEGAHDAGINSKSVGIEHVGLTGKTDFESYPEQLWASARVAAAFCHYVGKKPSRDFIIGHSEDAKYGGTSTHTDPGKTWPWGLYMEMVQAAYDGQEEWDDMAFTDFKEGWKLFRTGARLPDNANADKVFGYNAAKDALTKPAGDGGGLAPHTHEVTASTGREVAVP